MPQDKPLNAFLAAAGVCSRRNTVDVIKKGRVAVNGHIITEPGFRVTSEHTITLDGKPVTSESFVYILMNKPVNTLTTTSDEMGRRTVLDIIKGIPERIVPVGRLDKDTTGLLLLTNNGDLAQHLAHPRYEVKKIYSAMLDRPLEKPDFLTIKRGLQLEDGFIRVDSLKLGKSDNEVIVTVHSGRNRIVRRIFEHVGYVVKHLERIGYAGLEIGNLNRGTWRHLKGFEIDKLKKIGR